MHQSEESAKELTKNTFHLISAIKISTSWTVSMDDGTVFAENCKTFSLSNQHLFPKQKSKPNHHFADHIPELFQCWGPAQASATWGYDCLIGVFAKMPTVTGALMEARVAWHSGIKNSLGGLQRI
ncbi:hypothetical protein O181_051429 [Austropuccinia psidii MF-1]|uniref:Uncharacterized protein n=1 Tax=Austropuccinia psidii MF-1 TaxID=1389203 RepID=A0A9Q3DYQ4_9BASI|nr:hypothetical protein [Austropuccinia psidii MF-1]